MERRSFFALAVGSSVGIAGCSGVLSESGDGDDATAEVAERFYRRLVEGERRGALALAHPDAEVGSWVDDAIDLFDHNDTRVLEAEGSERSGDRAVVDVTIEDFPESDSSLTYTAEIAVRKHEGEWLVYGAPDDGSEADPRPPQAQFEVTERTGDDGRTTAVAFEHQGGDTIDVTTLRVTVGDEIGGPEGDGSMSTGSTAVATFTAEEGYAAGRTATLQWHSSADDETATIVEHELETETAGRLVETFGVE